MVIYINTTTKMMFDPNCRFREEVFLLPGAFRPKGAYDQLVLQCSHKRSVLRRSSRGNSFGYETGVTVPMTADVTDRQAALGTNFKNTAAFGYDLCTDRGYLGTLLNFAGASNPVVDTENGSILICCHVLLFLEGS
jgi:hypothetical protein